MPMMLRLALPCLLLAAACTQSPDPAATCGADRLQSLVGQPAKVLQTLRFGTTTRIIRPGMAITMDFSPERLNVAVDTAETITDFTCG